MGMDSVWLLWHTHPSDDGGEDSKLIGVYSSQATAQAAQGRICNQPGFLASPNGFEMVEYVLDQDQWAEGFVTVRN